MAVAVGIDASASTRCHSRDSEWRSGSRAGIYANKPAIPGPAAQRQDPGTQGGRPFPHLPAPTRLGHRPRLRGVFRGRVVQHPRRDRCGTTPGGAGPHATWDCQQLERFWDVHGTCPGFNCDGSRDPTQWHGDNLTRAAKAEWARLIRDQDIVLPSCAPVPVPRRRRSWPDWRGSSWWPRRPPPLHSPWPRSPRLRQLSSRAPLLSLSHWTPCWPWWIPGHSWTSATSPAVRWSRAIAAATPSPP